MSFDRRYWTTHCEGFRVEFPGGAHGYVDEVRYADEPERVPALVVRVGALGRRVAIVPVEAIQLIVPRAERIWLKSPLELERTERAQR